jgi:hypothetical protein
MDINLLVKAGLRQITYQFIQPPYLLHPQDIKTFCAKTLGLDVLMLHSSTSFLVVVIQLSVGHIALRKGL